METKLEQKNELALLVEKSGLETETAKSLQETFQTFLDQANQWKAKAGALVVTDVNQKREMQEARVARLALRDIRIKVEGRRKELKEDSLRKGKAIDSVANLLKGLIEPIEEHLEKQEKFAELAEVKNKAELKATRTEMLGVFGIQTEFYDLSNMPQNDFDQLYNNCKKAYEERIAAEKKAEEDRIAAELEQQKERERVREENERLKKEALERERVLLEERKKAEAARKAAEETARKQREAAEKKLADEKARAEAEQKKMREEAQKKLAQERAERERVEAELKAKQEEEAKAKAEAEAAAEAELSKGDKEKFSDLVKDLEAVKTKYSFRSKKYKALGATVVELVDKTINWATSKQ